MNTDTYYYKYFSLPPTILTEIIEALSKELIKKTELTYEEHLLLRSNEVAKGIKVISMIKIHKPELSFKDIITLITKSYPNE